MPDRSSRQGLPDDWNRGRRGTRGQHSAGRAADGHEAGPAGSHRAGLGSGPANGHSAADTEALRPRVDSYGPGMNDGFASESGRSTAERFGNADPFGDAPAFGDARAFGDTRSFGATRAAREADAVRDPGAARDAATYVNGESYVNGDSYGKARSFGDPGAFGAGTAEAATGHPDGEHHPAGIGAARTGEDAESKGFLSALFDFRFTSFVTPKIIKVLYALITIGTVLSALVFTIIAFKASMAFGVAVLVFGDPLFVLIVLAIYRVILEFFMVTFRVAEDIQALRERGDLS